VSRARGLGLVAAAVGLAAAGTGTAVTLRRRSRGPAPQPTSAAGLGLPLPGEKRAVETDDGVRLAAVTRGKGELTVVFCHGWAGDSRAWHYQWQGLSGHGRLVAYDQRCHGRSGCAPAAGDAIGRLGADLAEVLDALAPSGPVALVGHSMGGMTIMALAAAHPELFGDRVVAVALLATSAGRLAEVTFGLPALLSAVAKRVVPWAVPQLGRRAALVDRSRGAMPPEVVRLLTQTFGFRSHVPPAAVELLTDMIARTPFSVIADFYPAFARHDKLEAIGVLRKVETLVLAADRDLVTPREHSRAIAGEVPGAELVVVPHSGHMVMLEHPDLVTAALAGWLARVS
jgi:pimeloyl-ACP methyl ester carboxylesterase